jgi:anhydro-N-acetylmuramic acid kinase
VSSSRELYIGLMSGTSLDGVDGVLVDLGGPGPNVLQHTSSAFPAELRAELLALNAPGADELHRAALAANALSRSYAEVVHELLASTCTTATDVRAIGAHGQTVRHRPGEFDGTGYTLQLNQPALLAELTGIDVVADFRSRDVAAGGQGAPLVPAFHQGLFGKAGTTVAVLNIGGISNLSVLGPGGEVLGFDCGPGNALMDHWCLHHTGTPFDAAGAWAAQGVVIEDLLHRLLATPFLAKAPPKSTGRDLFNPLWLGQQLMGFENRPAQDIQATLTEFTARACALHVQRHATGAQSLLVCGGGALNANLMMRMATALPGIPVVSTETAGLPPLQVEACAFAWLARQTVLRRPGNLPTVTGAAGLRVLGALYPA